MNVGTVGFPELAENRPSPVSIAARASLAGRGSKQAGLSGPALILRRSLAGGADRSYIPRWKAAYR